MDVLGLRFGPSNHAIDVVDVRVYVYLCVAICNNGKKKMKRHFFLTPSIAMARR